MVRFTGSILSLAACWSWPVKRVFNGDTEFDRESQIWLMARGVYERADYRSHSVGSTNRIDDGHETANREPMIIAIDGTLASGKGTIAKRLARWYGLAHMDTGRLYRATGVAALNKGVDFADHAALAEVALRLDLNDYEEEQLRTAEAGQAASKVAAIAAVRAALLELQRAFARQPKGAVLDGRDIGTVVCPDADVKLWIDADVEVRAARRWKELTETGDPLSLDEMIGQLKERDERDRNRADAPMVAAADSVLIDTTQLTIDAAVDKARAAVDAAIAQKTESSEP